MLELPVLAVETEVVGEEPDEMAGSVRTASAMFGEANDCICSTPITLTGVGAW
jgi:hypothetical protein